MTGYRVRMAESAGMPLSRLLPSTNPWGNGGCGQIDCVVGSQEDEKKKNCTMRNILYENRCTICNVKDGKDTQPFLMDGKGIYVGESSRSMYERKRTFERQG